MSFGLASNTTNWGCTWLSASQLIHKKIEGHDVIINMDSKVLIMDLAEMFRHARQKLQWDEKYGNLAFGINRSIINLVIGAELKLLIHFLPDSNAEYWINYDTLRDFKKSVNCLSFVSKTIQVYNIPVSLFKTKPIFSGVIH